ncbi:MULTISPECIES: SusC/RagA family TonB-linked outer membrane protein [Sphingobacterium]|uniref:SusC/RagA family TonB-linked outer membrane protein n=1 Tax=Sphingobacterium TaxID=28453 RepID=UPI00104AE2FB|nr:MULTISPECIES: SusC/RagA family TonB-linked outer membrane protein [Sphingobacterium]MCW2263080.1 TonB-linked SusC/RagA family outer membrane protein [Sphingobacterium kitahiroshimense]TCR11936.1 TonB-linked SusC/RagA family outer membrane protein [Sphingobacterium sp. JUb78]
MKINERPGGNSYVGTLRKILILMKLTTFILLISLVQVSAITNAQITIKERNITLQKIMDKISLQSGYDFIYLDSDLINLKAISVDLKNENINTALKICFADQPLTYFVNDKTVMIKKKQSYLLNSVVQSILVQDIKGIVLDEKGAPLAGVTVRLKGSKIVVTTDGQGQFFLNKVGKEQQLQVSFVGYRTKDIVIGVSRDITVKMELATSVLEEVAVVNTGYQTISKERATGAFNTISQEQLEKPATSIAQRLIGTTAGMQATLDADGNPRFEIRGQSALNIRDGFGVRNQNAAPLVVVDGFPIQGDFSTINPNDVETVTVLKDAAAASIWGAKSANGVIVVVTKKGKKGTPLAINFSAFTRISKKLDLDYVNPLASSSETIDYEMKSFGNWGASINGGNFPNDVYKAWSPGTIALSEYNLGHISLQDRDALLTKYKGLSNKKQIKDELLKNPSVQQYNLDFSGSNERMSNRVSLLYENTQSNFKYSDNKKYNVNYNTSADIFKWLKLNFGGLVNYNKINRSGANYNVNPYGSPNPLADIANIAPYEMLRNEDGSLNNIGKYYTPIIDKLVPTSLFPYADWTYNPIQEIENRKYTSEQLNTRLQAGLSFKIIKGLTFDTKIQYELFNTTNRNWNNENTFYVRNIVNSAASWNRVTNRVTPNLPKGGILEQGRVKTESYIFRNQLNFERKFKEDHEISFIGGTEINNLVSQTFTSPTAYGYNSETLGVGIFPNGPGTPTAPIVDWTGFNQSFEYVNKFTHVTDRYFSLFGNASYTYKRKYTLSGSIRTDASNLITDDPSYRYAPFWSLGGSWQISKEQFMQESKWIDHLALRATYGYNGNVDRSTSFRPLIAIEPSPNLYTGDYRATISSYGNPNLRWEKTGTWNIGVDYSLFGGSIFGKVDVYNKAGKDLIATLSIPGVNGTTRQNLNNAAMTNKGIELEIGTVQRLRGNDIVWRGNANFSYNKNQITKLFVANYYASSLVGGGSNAYVEGEDSNTLWAYEYTGVKNNQPTIAGPNGTFFDFATNTPGNGTTYLLNMGTTVAPYTLGFTNSFKVYDFNFSFIVTGKFGHKFKREGFNYPATLQSRVLPNKKINEVLNGDLMQVIPLPLNQIEPRYYFWGRFHPYMNYLVENASHIRMQEINLTYNLPFRLGSKINLKRVQVFAQGNDLFTVVANKAGEDPEYPLGTLKPQPRISLGIKCEL